MSKLKTGWYSQRVGCDMGVVRWGAVGTPVLLFPTAGGDAEEIERFHVVDALGDLIEAGRVKIYSCDSVAGRAMLTEAGSPQHRMWMQNQFEQFVYPRAGAGDPRRLQLGGYRDHHRGFFSIGAFNALAVLARYPDAFTHAVCVSGTYDLDRFLRAQATDDWYFSSPLHFIPGLSGELLERLRTRFVLLASGEGKAEDIDESWRMADVLGEKGIPNRVDSWGGEWHHDWITWRRMFPQYLGRADGAVGGAISEAAIYRPSAMADGRLPSHVRDPEQKKTAAHASLSTARYRPFGEKVKMRAQPNSNPRFPGGGVDHAQLSIAATRRKRLAVRRKSERVHHTVESASGIYWPAGGSHPQRLLGADLPHLD